MSTAKPCRESALDRIRRIRGKAYLINRLSPFYFSVWAKKSKQEALPALLIQPALCPETERGADDPLCFLLNLPQMGLLDKAFRINFIDVLSAEWPGRKPAVFGGDFHI